MDRLKVVVLLAMVVALAACSSDKTPDAGEFAGRAAKVYYDHLLNGQYAAYVDGFYRPERIPDGYHTQLVENAKMFVDLQKKDHQGIARVDVARVKADTARHVADVFLTLCYGDSGKEQIVVPMIQKKGIWLMR